MSTLTKLIHNIHSSIEQELGEKNSHIFGDKIFTESSTFFTGLLYYNIQSVDVLGQLINSDYKIIEEKVIDTFQMGNYKYVKESVRHKPEELITHRFKEYLLMNTKGDVILLGEIETLLDKSNKNYRRWYEIYS
jgi:hypothetical protein